MSILNRVTKNFVLNIILPNNIHIEKSQKHCSDWSINVNTNILRFFSFVVMALSVRWTLTVMSLTFSIAAATTPGEVERRSAVDKRQAPTEGDFADRSSDGSYAFRYADRNQFHSAAANKDNVVSGRYT